MKSDKKGVLIEIDTVSRVLAGGDENSSKDIGALIGTLTYIQEATNAHIGLLHHVPHDQQRMRGHGALLAACDTTVHVENAGAFRTARLDKTNDGAEGESLAFTFASVELHHDPDTGQITTAPIVQPVDGAAAKASAKVKLSKAAQIALRALTEVIIDQGETAPPSNHIPSGKVIVSLEKWRQQSYRLGISTSDEASAKRKAFQRAAEHLIAACRVGFYEEMVWLP
jgi:AAA domain